MKVNNSAEIRRRIDELKRRKATIDHIPYRHQFDSEIYQGNLENYEAAVKADLNGDDSREQRVWWNRR